MNTYANTYCKGYTVMEMCITVCILQAYTDNDLTRWGKNGKMFPTAKNFYSDKTPTTNISFLFVTMSSCLSKTFILEAQMPHSF